MTVTLDSLTADPSGRAVLKFTSDTYFKAERVGVAVRNSWGANLDYPGMVSYVNIGPEGYTFISDKRNPLSSGTYTVFGFYRLNGIWHNLPSQPLVVGEEPEPEPEPEPNGDTTTVPGKTVVFHGDNFLDTSMWGIGRTSAFPGGGPGQNNYGDYKADYIHPAIKPSLVHDADLGRDVWRFRATRKGPDEWNVPLATTEYVGSWPQWGFSMRPGDTVTAKFKFTSEIGQWPSLWTWGMDNAPGGPSGRQPGHGEVDFFEYHSDNPNKLELNNRVSGGSTVYNNSSVVQPGRWISMRVDCGTSRVDWYIDDQFVFSANGLPSYWHGWPIVKISIHSKANPWHPEPPANLNVIDFFVTDYKIWR